MGVAVGQGRRSRSTSLHVLLLLLPMLATQGVMPDCHDLASPEHFGMSCFVLEGGPDSYWATPGGKKVRGASVQVSARSDEDPAVTSGQTEEPASDEAGESVLIATPRISLPEETVPRYLGVMVPSTTTRLNPAQLKHHRGAPGDEARCSAPIDSLCRLTC